MSVETLVAALVAFVLGMMVSNHPLSLLGGNAQDAVAVMAND